MSKAGSAFGKFVVWLLAVVFIVAVVGVALYFGLREQGMTFYVEYNGQRYVGGTGSHFLSLWKGDLHEFSVKSLAGSDVDYSVKVVSNNANNFRFSVGGELYTLYSDDEERNDYSDVFGLEQTMSGFSVTIPRDMTVETAIETKYGGDITFLDELSDNTAYFVIIVMVENSFVDLAFTFPNLTLTIDPPSVVF